MGDPPGGPPDTTAPQILRIAPDSGANVPGLKGDLEIVFDEVIDEAGGGGGGGGGGGAATGLGRFVVLSPVAGGVKVSWHRSRITVKPREGWKRRAYRLELLPGIIDLRNNRIDTGRVVMFTTGPEIGHARIGGIALSWVEQRIMPRALIEAVPLPDSVGYLTVADSGGQFNLEGLAPGRYIVYATADENGDRRRGLREVYDSVPVTLDSSTNAALYAFVHDTIPPRIRSASFIDSVSVRVEFSQPLDPAAPLDTSRARVRELPDSTPIPIARVLTQREADSLATAARQKADSLRADSLRAAEAARDTSQRQPPAPPRQPPQARQPPAGAKAPPVDTALVRRLLALRPIPSGSFVLTMAQPLKPETRYVIEIEDATNLTGRKGGGQVVLLVPKPAPPDTTKRSPPRQPPL